MSQQDHIDQFTPLVGKELGVSDWIIIDQKMVDDYGVLTKDEGFIHNAPEWSKANTPFGNTIVQGSFLMSNFVYMVKSCGELHVKDWAYRMNYGFNRVRIVNPVITGSRIRGRFALKDVQPKGNDAVVTTLEAVMEIENGDGPAIVAEWLFYVKYK